MLDRVTPARELDRRRSPQRSTVIRLDSSEVQRSFAPIAQSLCWGDAGPHHRGQLGVELSGSLNERLHSCRCRQVLSPDVSGENGKGRIGGIFDSPLYKDWTIWLFVAIAAAGIWSTYLRYTVTNPFTGGRQFTGETNAFLIEVLITSAFNFLLWGVLPAAIRSWVRKRRASAAGS